AEAAAARVRHHADIRYVPAVPLRHLGEQQNANRLMVAQRQPPTIRAVRALRSVAGQDLVERADIVYFGTIECALVGAEEGLFEQLLVCIAVAVELQR